MYKLTLSIPGSGGTITLEAPPGVPTGGLYGPGTNIIGVGIQVAILATIIITLLFFIRGGVNWVMSKGDKEKLQKARERLQYSIIGLVIVFLSFLAVNILGSVFGIDLLGLLKSPPDPKVAECSKTGGIFCKTCYEKTYIDRISSCGVECRNNLLYPKCPISPSPAR